jgi:hypothetical protein
MRCAEGDVVDTLKSYFVRHVWFHVAMRLALLCSFVHTWLGWWRGYPAFLVASGVTSTSLSLIVKCVRKFYIFVLEYLCFKRSCLTKSAICECSNRKRTSQQMDLLAEWTIEETPPRGGGRLKRAVGQGQFHREQMEKSSQPMGPMVASNASFPVCCASRVACVYIAVVGVRCLGGSRRCPRPRASSAVMDGGRGRGGAALGWGGTMWTPPACAPISCYMHPISGMTCLSVAGFPSQSAPKRCARLAAKAALQAAGVVMRLTRTAEASTSPNPGSTSPELSNRSSRVPANVVCQGGPRGRGARPANGLLRIGCCNVNGLGLRISRKAQQVDDLVQAHDICYFLETRHTALSFAQLSQRWCIFEGYTAFCAGITKSGIPCQGVAVLVVGHLLPLIKVWRSSVPGAAVQGVWLMCQGDLSRRPPS